MINLPSNFDDFVKSPKSPAPSIPSRQGGIYFFEIINFGVDMSLFVAIKVYVKYTCMSKKKILKNLYLTLDNVFQDRKM